MFQTPVNNLEKIRKARKRVKQLLLQIGLETCREEFEDINTNNPGDTLFSSTSWEDVSLWEANGRRNGYRTKPFCCSLCKFSTRLLSSFKSHLQRYHEDEKDQELMASCPSCPFTSQTKNVVKHMRIFHSSVRKVPSTAVKESPNTVKTIGFACVKCSFTETLYYSMKRHVLLTHHLSELKNYFGEKSEEELKSSSGLKPNTDGRFYCKKCNCIASTHDALMYHILTSDKHRDLEQKLRSDISDVSRPHVRRPYKKILAPTVAVAVSSKPPILLANSAASPTTKDGNMVSLTQNGPNQTLLGASTAIISNLVPTIATVSDSSRGLVKKTATTVASTAQVGFVTAPISQNQGITLQAPLSQSVFLSPRFPLNQPVTATMLSPGCNVGGQIITGTQGGLLPVNQSAVINVSQTVRSSLFPINQPLKTNNLTGNQSGILQNTVLTAPILRQLIPTGKQVNGIPTYTLAPLSVTLPVAQCGIPSVNPPKVPIQLSQPDKVVQVSTSPANAQSPPVAQLGKTTTKQTPNIAIKNPVPASDALGKETKQWKTCPVCNELFPSNVYEVHMQIAHLKQENSPNKPTDASTNNEAKEAVVIAAQASFLKVLKLKSIRCVTCKEFTQGEQVLKHLLMHGMVCLYCKAVFHQLRNFIYHMNIMHVSKKNVHGDFVKKGITISRNANGDVLFPYFDFNFIVPREELGDKEMHLAVVAGANANIATTLYIKIQPTSEPHIVVLQKNSKCQFCNSALSKSEVYETHLKEKHHIMPTVHTILKIPAFKCIHCCGVYTGSMTLSAISVHLLRCRNAPKDSTSGVELLPENTVHTKQKTGSLADTHIASNEPKNGQKSGLGFSRDLSSVPSKRRRIDSKSDSSEHPLTDLSLDILVLIPDSSAALSHESQKEFLSQYFHIKPYPSKREIEVLSSVLDMWKSDVASFFGTKRYICMKFLKNHKQQVLLGFKMAELKQVKHDIELEDDY